MYPKKYPFFVYFFMVYHKVQQVHYKARTKSVYLVVHLLQTSCRYYEDISGSCKNVKKYVKSTISTLGHRNNIEKKKKI